MAPSQILAVLVRGLRPADRSARVKPDEPIYQLAMERASRAEQDLRDLQ